VIERGPVYFFNLERGLIRKRIEISIVEFKANCRTDIRTYHIRKVHFLIEPLSCSEFVTVDNPFSVSISSNFGMCSIIKVLFVMAHEEFIG